MKKIFTSFLLLTGMTVFAQVNNPGFEDWTAGAPDSWETSNVQGSVEPVTQSTDAHSGTYAIRLGVVSAFGFSVPGAITQMEFPINYVPETMSFWLKSSLAANTQVYGTMAIFDAGGNTLGVASFGSTVSSSSYIEVVAPSISTGANGVATYGSITISMATTDGSTLATSNNCTIDDISISSVPLSVEESAVNTVSIYPNPCTFNSLNIDLSKLQGQVQIQILDMQGKVVMTEKVVGGAYQAIDVSDLSEGVYVMYFNADSEVLTTKLVIE